MCYAGEPGVAGTRGMTSIELSLIKALDAYIPQSILTNFKVSVIGGQERSGKTTIASLLVNNVNSFKDGSACVIVKDPEEALHFDCRVITIDTVAKHNKHYFKNFDRICIQCSSELSQEHYEIIADRFENTSFMTIVV